MVDINYTICGYGFPVALIRVHSLAEYVGSFLIEYIPTYCYFYLLILFKVRYHNDF